MVVALHGMGYCLGSCASDLIVLLIVDGDDFLVVSEAFDNGARWQSSSNEFWNVFCKHCHSRGGQAIGCGCRIRVQGHWSSG